MQTIRLEKGSETCCPLENTELIGGIVYEKAELDEKAIGSVKYIHSVFARYKLSTRPMDKAAPPQGEIRLITPENTILKPELAVTVNGETNPGWIVEFTDENTAEISYCVKPALYRNAGISELWIVDAKKETICIYNFKKNGLIPTVVAMSQRIKVGIYKDLFVSYKEFFKDRTMPKAKL